MSFIKGRKGFDTSEALLAIGNHELYNNIIERLTNIALAQFEWRDLPKTIDRYHLERVLLTHGRAVIFQPPESTLWIASHFIHQDGDFDIYGHPMLDAIQPIGAMGQKIPYNPATAYILYDNTSLDRRPLMTSIHLFARRLYEIEQTIRQNLRHQNTPYVITTPNGDNRNSIRQLFRQIFNFDPVITIKTTNRDGDLDKAITSLDTKVDLKVLDLQQAWKFEWNRALSMLGISAETTKRERMLTDELLMNRQEDTISLQARLMTRVEFCNRFNDDHPEYELSVNLADARHGEEMGEPYPADDEDHTYDLP